MPQASLRHIRLMAIALCCVGRRSHFLKLAVRLAFNLAEQVVAGAFGPLPLLPARGSRQPQKNAQDVGADNAVNEQPAEPGAQPCSNQTSLRSPTASTWQRLRGGR